MDRENKNGNYCLKFLHTEILTTPVTEFQVWGYKISKRMKVFKGSFSIFYVKLNDGMTNFDFQHLIV